MPSGLTSLALITTKIDDFSSINGTNFPNLTSLDLSNNIKLKALPDFTSLSKLTSFSLKNLTWWHDLKQSAPIVNNNGMLNDALYSLPAGLTFLNLNYTFLVIPLDKSKFKNIPAFDSIVKLKDKGTLYTPPAPPVVEPPVVEPPVVEPPVVEIDTSLQPQVETLPTKKKPLIEVPSPESISSP